MEGLLLDDEIGEKDATPISLFSSKILAISAGILCFGLLFKIQHWPFNSIMIIAGTGVASGHAAYRVLVLRSTPVERAMRVFIPLGAVCILFFWLRYTLTAFWFFLGSSIIGAVVDYFGLRNRE